MCYLWHPQVKWAATSRSAPDQPELPAGSACLECATLRVEAFPYFSWDELCAHSMHDAGKAEIASARASQSASSSANYLPSAVTSETTTRLRISRSTILMNALEYKNHFGKQVPGARGPKLPTLQVPREGVVGELEKVWVFADPAAPHRTSIINNNHY
jgi:hypothetical protein